jgi:hypothetical protein
VVPKSVCRAEAGGCRDLFDQHIDSFQQTPRLMNASLDLFAGEVCRLRFAADSPLEGAGFEPSVPRQGSRGLERGRRPPAPSSLDGADNEICVVQTKAAAPFVHHIHGNSNFAIIDNSWDRLLGYLTKS